MPFLIGEKYVKEPRQTFILVHFLDEKAKKYLKLRVPAWLSPVLQEKYSVGLDFYFLDFHWALWKNLGLCIEMEQQCPTLRTLFKKSVSNILKKIWGVSFWTLVDLVCFHLQMDNYYRD